MRFKLVILLIVGFANAAIIYVPTDYNTISAAVNSASEGDTVLVMPGIYNEEVDIDGDITLGSLDLVSPNSHYLETIVDGAGHGRAIDISCGNVKIFGLTIRNAGISTSTYTSSCGDIYIQNCVITGFENIAISMGDEHDNVYVSNCIINNTRSTYDWGIITVTRSDMNVEIDHTVIYSQVPNTPLGIRFTGNQSNLKITNSILYGFDETILTTFGATVEVSHSCIENGWAGTNNIEDYPDFQHPTAGSFRLSNMSPCIGVGSADSVLTFDIDGRPRSIPLGSTKDIGAFEHYLGTPELAHESRVIYVSNEGSDDLGDGAINNPFASIQTGINHTLSNDIVKIQPGIYHENLVIGDKDILITSEYSSSMDTSTINATIIDGNGSGSVITFLNQDDGIHSEMRGMTIRNGRAVYGGGVACYSSSPVLRDLHIVENSATSGGGGGMYLFESSPKIYSSLITNNTCADVAGGIYVKECDSVSIEQTIISNNLASGLGGGMFTRDVAELIIDGCLIVNNETSNKGGGFAFRGSFPTITKTTIVDNVAANTGGGIYGYSASTTLLTNSIVWGNTPNTVSMLDGCSLTAAFTDIEDGYAGLDIPESGVNWLEGNIFVDPVFSSDSTYSLSPLSECIDAGASWLELDGNVIIEVDIWDYAGVNPDMGYYEFGELNNSPPAAFSLILPAHEAQTDSASIFFVWFPTSDLEGDLIKYELIIESADRDTLIQDIHETIYLFRGDAFFEPGQNYTWYVNAHDGIDTVRSTEVNAFNMTPTLATNDLFQPHSFKLEQSFPNPFNPSTRIPYSIPEEVFVDLAIYDLRGRKIKSLVYKTQPPGSYSAIWMASDDKRRALSSGMYLAVLKAGTSAQVIKILYAK